MGGKRRVLTRERFPWKPNLKFKKIKINKLKD